MKEKQNLKIPYAVGSFEKLREDGYYFVDKTKFIRDLEQYEVPVFLRPRRFGKTLWCSTLACYYDINRKEKFDALFGDLAIGQNPTGNQNSYMILSFNFSKIAVDLDMAKLEQNFNTICSREVVKFVHRYAAYFGDSFTLDTTASLSSMVDAILQYADLYDLPPIYIIIDEYDNFSNQLITANREDLYTEITTGDSFLRTFFKVIKAGVEQQAISGTFITGVLPITMDDLTSGFNIAEIITLTPAFHDMLGFTQAEVDRYVEYIFEEYNFPASSLPTLTSVLKENYNGYKFFSESANRLYNSTIITYFLKYFLLNNGAYPRDLVDPNIKTDVSWIKKLCGGEQFSLELLEPLINGEGLAYDELMLSDKFNMHRFFDKEFYPVSLFYLGMLTVQTPFRMNFPNQTLTKIFTGYYNEISRFSVSIGYTDYFEQFLKDGNIDSLFAGYFTTYIGQIPAQAFDKINENFIRTTFFELCTRYLSRYFTFAIEVNYPTGRSDWEMVGLYNGQYKNQKTIIEFKYFKKSDQKSFSALNAPADKDIQQVCGYEEDTYTLFPQYSVRKYVCYVCANIGFKMFAVK